MADVFDNPTLAQDRAKGIGTPTALPPGPGFFDSVGLGYELAGAAPDWGRNQPHWEGQALDAVRKALTARGHQLAPYLPQQAQVARRNASAPRDWRERMIAAEDAFWGALAAERAKDPAFLSDMGDVQDWATLSAYAARRRREEMQRIGGELQGGSFTGQMVGALGHGLTDPTSYLPVGGQAKAGAGIVHQILTVGAREAAANVAMTAAMEPLVQGDAARIGVPRTGEDVLTDLLLSGAVGGTIGSTVKGAEIGLGALLSPSGRVAAEAAEAAIPPDIRTPDEQAAINVLRRQGELDEASPFVRDPAGDDAHAAGMGGWLDTIVSGTAPPRAGPQKRITRSELLSGTADPALLRYPARQTLKAHIRQAESGGNDRAVPIDPKTGKPRSSASGRYQFTHGTWIGLYKARYGSKGSNDAIWAKRFDPNLQEVLMDDLLAVNAGLLRGAEQPETAGNLYLLHFLGPRGLDLLRASPDTPVAQLLPADFIAKNPEVLRGKTAGHVRGWAARKAGEREVPAGAAPEAAPAPEPASLPEPSPVVLADADIRTGLDLPSELPSLRPELFPTAEAHAAAQVALWRERDAAEGYAAVVDDPPPPGPIVTVRPPAARQRSGPVHLMQEIADLGGLLDNEGHDLVKGRGIPKFMLGAGSIIRPDGTLHARGVDAIGEALHERGWFGPPATTPRPSESQILDLIERGAREKVYRPGDAEAMAQRAQARQMAAEEEDARFELAETAREAHGVELDELTLDDALMRRAQGETAEEAVAQAMEAAAWRDIDAAADPQQGVPAPSTGSGQAFEPDGPEGEAQADSIEHDLLMEIDGEAGGSFRIDENGEDVDLSELIEQLHEDEAAAATLRGCMAPGAEAAE